MTMFCSFTRGYSWHVLECDIPSSPWTYTRQICGKLIKVSSADHPTILLFYYCQCKPNTNTLILGAGNRSIESCVCHDILAITKSVFQGSRKYGALGEMFPDKSFFIGQRVRKFVQ